MREKKTSRFFRKALVSFFTMFYLDTSSGLLAKKKQEMYFLRQIK